MGLLHLGDRSEGANLNGGNLADAQVKGDGDPFLVGGGPISAGSPAHRSDCSDYSLVDGYLVGPNAELSNADLSGADLFLVDLFYADLAGVNFTGTDLSGVDLIGADLTGATWSNTTCPNGSNSSTNGSSPQTWSVTAHSLCRFLLPVTRLRVRVSRSIWWVSHNAVGDVNCRNN